MWSKVLSKMIFSPPLINSRIPALLFAIAIGTATPGLAYTCGGIPDSECDALYALYSSTGGNQWTDNTNWLSAEPAEDWYGITVEDGHVNEIDLSTNNLTGTIPPELGNLANLKWLYLNNNNLNGNIPPELGNLNSLWVMNLTQNNLTGTIPPELGNLPNVYLLYLSENILTGVIPPELGGMSSLRHLFLGTNGLSGAIPPELGNLPNLEILYLYENQLTGEIPPELGSIVTLTRVSLIDNNLTGTIPPELGNLPNLERLHLNKNQLTGEIPPELGSLAALTRLGLAENNLTGTIPPELGNLANLTLLDLKQNKLFGPIPPELGNLANLDTLDLSGNSLTGDLPAFLADPPGYLNLIYNCLHATDPAVLAPVEEKNYNRFISTQTLPPENVTAETLLYGGTGENRVLVSWDPISFESEDGGYRVHYQKAGSPDSHCHGLTMDKTSSSMIISNLEPGEEYSFWVTSVTSAHAFNRNDLESPDSQEDSTVSGGLFRAFIPVWKQSPHYFTGVVISNFGDTELDVDLNAYAPSGMPEPQGNASINVGAGLQQSRLGAEFFHGNHAHEDLSWIELQAENSNKMGSIFLYGVTDTQLLDGAESQSSYSKWLFFTRPLDEGFFAGWGPEIQMYIVNPTDEDIAVRCRLRGSNGNAFNYHSIPARGFIKGDSEDLVGEGHGIDDGYMEVEVTYGLGAVGFSRIEFPGVRTALGINAAEYSQARTLYSAQLAHGAGIVTNLQLANTSGYRRTVSVKAVADDGSSLGGPVQVEIPARNTYNADLGTLFGLEGEGVIFTGSLVVDTDGSGVIGDIIFADGETLEYAMSLPLQERLFQEAVFNHISNLPTVFTGFAFYNPGEETATVQIDAFGTNGLIVAEKTLLLEPGERISRTLNDPDIWPGFPIQSGGYIRIQSDRPIAGQQLFGDRALRYMAAVPPTTRVEGMFDD